MKSSNDVYVTASVLSRYVIRSPISYFYTLKITKFFSDVVF